MVVRRVVKLAVSFCLVLAIGATWVGPLFAQADAKKETQPPKAEAPATKKGARQDRAGQDRAGQEGRIGENRGPQGDGTAAASDPAGGPGQDRGRPQGRGRGHRRRPGRGAGRDFDRPAADPRHPDHGPRDRPANLEEHDGQEALCRQSRGLWCVVHGLRQEGLESINYAEDVRIINPSAGLKQWYDTRARISGAIHPGHSQGQGPRAQTGRGQESRRTEEDGSAHEARGTQEGLRQPIASRQRAPGSAGRRSIRASISTLYFDFPIIFQKSRTAKVAPVVQRSGSWSSSARPVLESRRRLVASAKHSDRGRTP